MNRTRIPSYYYFLCCHHNTYNYTTILIFMLLISLTSILKSYIFYIVNDEIFIINYGICTVNANNKFEIKLN